MKGYVVAAGYMGYVKREYMLFSMRMTTENILKIRDKMRKR